MFDDRLGGTRAAPETIQGSRRLVVDPPGPGAHSLPTDQLHRGLEEVHHQSQFIAIEIVHESHGGGGVQAVPADQPAHVGPVLLLDVGVVVLLVGPTAGELDAVGPAVADQLVVEELAAVVRIDALQTKGQIQAHLLEGRDDPRLPFAEHGSSLGPGGVDIREIEGMSELPLRTAARVRDQVDLGETRAGDIPVVGLDRDVVLEQGSWFGPTVDAPSQLDSSWAGAAGRSAGG